MSKEITIQPVQSKRDLKKFILFPWKIYKGDPNWVPPLIMEMKKMFDPKKNPFFQHAEVENFLAYRDGEIVGRISAIINDNHNEFHNEKTGFFGFYESVNDLEVARTLIGTAAEWVKDRGMDRLRGPMNFSTNDTCGLLVDGFDSPPVVEMTYNPPYYADLFEKAGLKKVKDLYAYYMDDSTPISPKIERIANILKKRHNVTVRSINMKKLREELDLVKIVYNDAWSKNWGFVPLTDAEIDYIADQLKTIVDPELAIFAFVNGEVAGFSVSLPDFNQALIKINGRLFPFGLFKLLWYSRKIDMIRVFIMGVREKFRHIGLDAIFYYETYMRGTRKGYHKGEFSWILEDNYRMRNTLEKMGARIYKTYRIYDLEFSDQ